MLRLLFIYCCIATALLCAFLTGIGAAETKHKTYYKFRSLVYLALGREQKPNRNAVYYREKISLFEHDSREDYEVVFIGDSLTDGADWQSFFGGYSIANRGINGDTTRGILQRMGSIAQTGAGKAFLMAGVNDLRRGLEISEVVENYREIIEQLLDANMEVFVQSTLLTRTNETNALIETLNRQLTSLAESTDNLHYIDLNTHLSNIGVLDKQYTYDGIHLNGKGYQVWRNAIAPLFESRQ